MKKVTFLDFSNPLPNRNGGGATLHIGALYIVSALEEKQYVVDYRDYQTSLYCNSLKLSDMLEFSDNSADIILISCMAYMLPLVVLFSERFKLANPEKKIILGGPGPAGVAEELVSAFSFIDYIIKGEGEETVPLLMDCIVRSKGDINKIPGIVYRTDKVYSNPIRRIRDLDLIKFPAYHAVDMKNYSTFGIITGRGCIYKCKFCDVHGLWGDMYQSRSIENVLDEIELLVYEYGINHFDIWDDTFIVNRKRVLEFVDGLEARKLNICWNCFGRINLIDEELLQKMSSAGCEEIFYGLESGSQRVLEQIDKKIDLRDVIRVIEMSMKYVKVSAHLIWGFPFETLNDMYRTIYLFNYLRGKIRVGIGQLWPYPTTPLFSQFSDILAVNESELEFFKILPFPIQNSEEEQLIHSLVKEFPFIFTQYTVFKDENLNEKREIMSRLLLLSGE